MKLHLKLFLVVTYILVLHQQPVTSHKHKKEEEASKEEGTKKDVVTPAIALATSIASTYILNWLKKTTSALANINNLSSKYLIFDRCDGINVEIPVPPTDLVPGKLSSEMETFNPAGVFGNLFNKLEGKNIWVRCAYETNFRKGNIEHKPFNARSKIIFLATLRQGKLGFESTLAIVMCDNFDNTKERNKCAGYESISEMKDMVESRIRTAKADEKKTDPKEKAAAQERAAKDPIMRVHTFEKEEDFKIKPIYYCREDITHCVSATMGNGGNAVVTQIYVHDYQKEDEFAPVLDPTDT